jgi:hypothetical protein
MSDKAKRESLERLQNQLSQARLDGNTSLVKKIEAIIKAINSKK